VPSNTYLCGDGSYVIIAGNGDGIFKRLMTAIGRPDLADDPALANNAGRAQQTEMLDGVIGDWTAQHDLNTILQRLEQAAVPCGRLYTAADILADAHYQARGMLES